jgi:TPP-dependent pyruvate/acetoin dehydrogenase alpha subunit
MTYRYRGHSVADAGLSYRTRDETGAWIDKDPIALLRQRLLGEGMSEEELVAEGLLAMSHDSHHHHDVPTSSPMDHGSLESARAANRLVGIAVLCC